MSKKKVTIIQRRLTHYRVAFFQSLRKVLEEREIELQLLIGTGTLEECSKHDYGELSWARQIPTRYFFKNKLCWQSVNKFLKDTDLAILTQENALLANQLIILGPRNFRVAFWGHGANLQSQHPKGIKERYKRWITKRVDWWFAYTQLSAHFIQATGFPTERLTVVNNSIDTSEFLHQLGSVTPSESQKLRSSLGMPAGPVGIYIGSLYVTKRLDFLFSAAELIRNELGTFNLLIVGDGPERYQVKSFCEKHPWAYWVGTQHGSDKALHISIADILLNPGLVGLGILDSFAGKVPMLTTDCKIHSPEISYLENGCNGVMTRNNIDDYVNTAVNLLNNPKSLDSLRKGCEASASKFTLEKMVNNFADGIANALTCDLEAYNGVK